jgi:hypothetical protein
MNGETNNSNGFDRGFRGLTRMLFSCFGRFYIRAICGWRAVAVLTFYGSRITTTAEEQREHEQDVG